MAAMEITAAELKPLLRELNQAEAVAVVPMTGGTSPTWRLDLADGEQLVFKAYAGAARWRDGKEAFAAAQLEALPIPVTRYLLIDDSGARLPYAFAIANYLPGATLKSLAGHPDTASAFRQVGALLRQLHGVRMPAYGAFGANGIVEPLATNVASVRQRIESAFPQFERQGADPALASRLRRIVDARFDSIVPHSPGAVFAHDDLHPNNVLFVERADRRLELSGLIDFGNARAADAVSDLAKCLFCSAHDMPGCMPAILSGYGPIEHPDPEGALWFYTLLHRVTMWSWLRHVGILASPDAPIDLIDDLREMAEAA